MHKPKVGAHNSSRCREILSAFNHLGIQAVAYRANERTDAIARGACLRAFVQDLAGLDALRLVIERDDSVVTFDRQLLYRELRDARLPDITYDRERAASQPLLDPGRRRLVHRPRR